LAGWPAGFSPEDPHQALQRDLHRAQQEGRELQGTGIRHFHLSGTRKKKLPTANYVKVYEYGSRTDIELFDNTVLLRSLIIFYAAQAPGKKF
jgi:hypothetical protein